MVQEYVSFGRATPPFSYSLGVASDNTALTARYHDHTMQVLLPSATAHAWASTDQVGIEETLSIDDTEVLHILIEKDFQCLHRTDEEEPDHYPNPAAVDR